MRKGKDSYSVVIIFVIFIVIMVLSSMGILNPYWLQIIQFALIITISSLGLNLIYGYTGQFSLGHAAFYGIGAYSSALVTKSLHSLG
ncbi:MAG: branched-chain amino acid ABC transporter permease, partial [candidate division WOR-3 bacterium]